MKTTPAGAGMSGRSSGSTGGSISEEATVCLRKPGGSASKGGGAQAGGAADETLTINRVVFPVKLWRMNRDVWHILPPCHIKFHHYLSQSITVIF
jgi:hypothetical protein